MKHNIFVTSRGHTQNTNQPMFNTQGQLNGMSLKQALDIIVKYAAAIEERYPSEEGDVK